MLEEKFNEMLTKFKAEVNKICVPFDELFQTPGITREDYNSLVTALRQKYIHHITKMVIKTKNRSKSYQTDEIAVIREKLLEKPKDLETLLECKKKIKELFYTELRDQKTDSQLDAAIESVKDMSIKSFDDMVYSIKSSSYYHPYKDLTVIATKCEENLTADFNKYKEILNLMAIANPDVEIKLEGIIAKFIEICQEKCNKALAEMKSQFADKVVKSIRERMIYETTDSDSIFPWRIIPWLNDKTVEY